jgi:hypothetical protein
VVTAPFPVRFDGAHSVECVEVGDVGDLAVALGTLGLSPPNPVVVVVGGAGGLQGSELDRLRPLFSSGLVPVLERLAAVGVDGGTYSGVMRLLGEARAQEAASFPLVGVAARGTIRLPGDPAAADGAADLDPHHTQLLLVPGEEWGDESPWIARIATELAGTAPSVTVLVNGGDIAYSDVRRSVEAGRAVVAVAGSGRTADELAAALRREPADQRAVELAATGLVRAVPAEDPSAVAALVTNLLGGSAMG